MNDKRGLSTIIVTLILILLSLVAVGIVWVVVSNILQSGTEQTSSGLGQIFLSIGIENVKVESNGDVSVSVKRNAGEGDLSGINFIVSDGENSQVIKKSESLGELATKTFTITSAELTGVAFVKEVSIAPISGTEGKEKIGSVVDSFEKNKIGLDDLKDYGIVSWWRFEDDAKDEVGGNNGTLQGSVNFIDGKFGKAANFDGSGDWMEISSPYIDLGDAWTVSTWFLYPLEEVSHWRTLTRGNAGDHQVIVQSGNYNLGTYDNTVGTVGFKDSGFDVDILQNGWHYLAAVQDGMDIIYYIDGNKASIVSNYPSTTDIRSIGNHFGGGQEWGVLDEVMIFNKALKPEQVKAIYEMNLN